MDNRIKQLISEMTVEEKALLCSGRKFWFTRGIKKYDIEPYMVTDGPHGLRKQSQSADNLGINDSKAATCFPAACTMASSWDTALIAKVGEAIGEEAKQEQVGVVLGPGANIKRSPLCGRNFEYYSEDPYLSGKCAAAFINGVQKNGTGTSLKHFAVNNQEGDRLRINAVVDERALREIYLATFETAVKEAQPRTVMCSYNKVNGLFSSENNRLINGILRDEWGFKGYVMTDWGAINDRVEGLKCGIDLEMPGGSAETTKEIVAAVENGSLDIEVLDKTVERLLQANFSVKAAKEDNYVYDIEAHHQLVREVAAKGAVLLKNDDKTLPLSKTDKIIAIGELCKIQRYQGSGSSLIKPNKLISPYEALEQGGANFVYSAGYSVNTDMPDMDMIDEAVKLAKETDGKIVVFAGLTMFYESEGFDRKHLRLPDNQNLLISKLVQTGKDVTVVLFGGSPVEMPWIDDVKAVLNMYLAGQAVGLAVYDLLFGDVNPSGKLAETYPLKLEDNPSYEYFPQGPMTVEYRESIYVGYRYYDKADKEVLFPFGYGLSYTDFEYSDLKLSANTLNKGESLKLTFKVKNVGAVAGGDAVQIYVSKPKSEVFRAPKELKAFAKVYLAPDEEKTVELELTPRAFAYYNVKSADWVEEPGEYEVAVAASSRDIRLKETVIMQGDAQESPYDQSKIFDYLKPDGNFSLQAFTEVLGAEPPSKEYVIAPVRWETSTGENRLNWFGKLFGFILVKGATVVMGGKDENSKIQSNFVKQMMLTNSLRSMATTSGGMLTKQGMAGLILMFNGHFFKGLSKLLKAMRANKKYDKHLAEIEDVEYKGKV